MHTTQSEEEKIYNGLAILKQGDYHSLKIILNQYGSWLESWNYLKKTADVDIEKEWERLKKNNVALILKNDPRFPALLKEIPWPPFGLYVKGQLPTGKPTIAIVGTRKATDAGKNIAERFADKLARYGITVVSGLAMGIDEAAHSGTIKAGGETIAVLANGLDTIYPRQNKNLAEKILELKGALVSEYPFGSPSYPNRFIERNRIISGLSSGIIIIEAPESSGALSTANFGLEQNREIFVVPGPINNPNYIGSNQLIKKGACLVASVEEILEELNLNINNLETSSTVNNNTAELKITDENQKLILKILKQAGKPLTVDKICQLTEIETPAANRALTFLLIKDIIKETEKGYTASQ